MCGCEKHRDEAAPCDCICDEHANFEAARDLAMRRHDAIVVLERELEQVKETREKWMSRALEAEERAKGAEQRLRDIESIAEQHIGEIAAGKVPPPLFD